MSSLNDASTEARVMAGIPATNNAFYRRIQFLVGDPAALIELRGEQGQMQSLLILRDIEMQRARQSAAVDQVGCPKDYEPESGLSGDRETATAQAVAECLRRSGVKRAVADRTLPLIFAHQMSLAGIAVDCDTEWGVLERRSKTEQEIELIREAQGVTEAAIRMACETVAGATAGADGVLLAEGEPLTVERLRAKVDIWLLEQGYSNPHSIIAPGPQGADCHDVGSGAIKTSQPVIVDIFPRNRHTLYNGDCTRTVVHGAIPPKVQEMHAAVVAAKAAAQAVCRAGVTGEQVHAATVAEVQARGYSYGLPSDESPADYCALTHGTGHGIGLDVHEPPLLDKGGPELVHGDAVTIEPGLYCSEIGGVRVEDIVVVHEDRCESLNKLPEGLVWA